MESEQKRLYKHYKNLSVEGETDKQRIECGKYAAEILKSFPQFEKKVDVVPKGTPVDLTKDISKEEKEKK